MSGSGTGSQVSALSIPGGIVTGPSTEPISLAELKLYLRLDSGAFSDNIDTVQSIAPGSHNTTVGYALLGTAVEVAGYDTVVNLVSGTNGATGTVDVKILESDDNSTWIDWTGGAFTQVTTANDNATYEIAYTGHRRYIRTAAKVLLAASEFGTEVIRNCPTTSEDALLESIITAARELVEEITNRALITQTWDYCLEQWPNTNYITLPFGNLQNVTSIKYLGTDGTSTTMVATTDYLVETNSDRHGRIVLPYATPWPSSVLYPTHPITIRFVCGWSTAADVPSRIKLVIYKLCEDMYQHRGTELIVPSTSAVMANPLYRTLLYSFRLWME